MFSKKVEDYDN
jgi:hypothetical protein